jgi:3-isopropylmalate/(R)-2-methylmalate dehydratase large subunit
LLRLLRTPAQGQLVIESLKNRKIEKRPPTVKLQGRILFLTEDPELIKKQLAGWDMPWDAKNPANNPKLRDDISTDEITPAHICFYFDEEKDRAANILPMPN